MPLILGTNSIKDTGYDVANSLRFNPGSTDTLTRTFGTPTNNKKFTISFWIKKCENGREQHIFSASSSAQFYFNSSDQLYFYDQTSGNTIYKSTQLFRDPSAWMHIVVAEDTTVATAGNRLRIYVNGSEVTNFATETHPTQDNASAYNTASAHTIGTYPVSPSGYYLSAYLAEFVFIDGQQLDPTSFGEFDEDSPTIWKPKDVSGLTFGNNGFHLDFENASSLGADVSGNSNNFTVNNLTSIDQSTDTCTNNFCTMNPLNRYQYNFTFEEGNLKVSNSSNNWHAASGTIGINTGKWYFEAKYTGSSNLQHWYVGFGGEAQNASDATRNSVAFYNNDGGEVHTSDVSNNTATTADYGTFSQNDIIGIALDYDNEYISVYKNGSAIVTNYDYGATSYSSNLKDGKTIFPYVAHYASGDISMNFGSPPYSISSGNTDANGHGNFEYAVPSGYFALCTKNLAESG